jgi:predicted AlkP superfamily phosphohydrolase/phosphomutase
MSKIVVLGLDGFSPGLVKEWIDDLPNLKKAEQEGIWGKMNSTVPPSTFPAWTCSQTGRNPGAFGFWDSTYRDNFDYGEPKIVDSRIIKPDPLYRLLPKRGQKVAIINVPGTWPPPEVPGGYSISGLKTPRVDRGFTWPESLKKEVSSVVGDYMVDPADDERSSLDTQEELKLVYERDSQRLRLLKHFIQKKQCDYILAAIRGPYCMARTFYHYYDEQHRHHRPDSNNRKALHDYYVWVDKQIGDIRGILDDETALLIHSVHGVQRLGGRVNLNEWLINNGYMSLAEYPSAPTAFNGLNVNWPETKCWAAGDAGKIYLNLKGRELQGTLDPDVYDGFLDELAEKIRNIPDENGKELKTQVFKRRDIDPGPCSQYGPDLLILFDECRWGTNEKVGYGQGNIHTLTTPDEADNVIYSLDGYVCIAGPGVPTIGEYSGDTLLDLAPTVLDVMGLEIPGEMEGRSLLREGKPARPPEDEEKVRSRLKALGY